MRRRSRRQTSLSKTTDSSSNRVALATESVIEKKGIAPGVLPDVTAISNSSLLAWMFRFLRPVRSQVFFACTYLTFAVGAEVLAVKQTGRSRQRDSTARSRSRRSGRLPSLVSRPHRPPSEAAGCPPQLLHRHARSAGVAAGSDPRHRPLPLSALPPIRLRGKAQHDDGLLHPRSGVRQTPARRASAFTTPSPPAS